MLQLFMHVVKTSGGEQVIGVVVGTDGVVVTLAKCVMSTHWQQLLSSS
jgi:hypothetical protein